MSASNRKKNSEYVEIAKGLSMIFQIGINIMVSIAISLLIGYGLDKLFGTGYWIVVFMFVGMAAGIKSIYTITKGFYADDLKRENEQQKYFDDLHSERRKVQDGKDGGR